MQFFLQLDIGYIKYFWMKWREVNLIKMMMRMMMITKIEMMEETYKDISWPLELV